MGEKVERRKLLPQLSAFTGEPVPPSDGDDLLDLGNFHANGPLDPRLEGQGGHGAATARAHELNRDDAVIGNVHDLHIAPVHLDRGTDTLQSLLDPLAHRSTSSAL